MRNVDVSASATRLSLAQHGTRPARCDRPVTDPAAVAVTGIDPSIRRQPR